MAHKVEIPDERTPAKSQWRTTAFHVLRQAGERLASTASEFVAVVELVESAQNRGSMMNAEPLCAIADDLHKHIEIYCAELGIGVPAPESTTSGAPVAAVDVPEESNKED